MGNNDTRSIRFRQSLNDFPCTVALGVNQPSFALSRNKKGLRIFPPENEGYTLRGDKRRLLYKGRRRSHRFTILGDTSFEYDCILEREPESNVITLLMEGADKYDFFRQPDFVKDPFMKGSYAVYKKETLLGEGTGKLCHIQRPLIIDALGRRVWGRLAVVGNELRITIPEWWLAGAKYPVVVDPTIGTSTVGSLTIDDDSTVCFDCNIPVNRFLVSDDINGLCTAYFYTNQDDRDAGGRPVLYSDNGNKPYQRKSMVEQFVDLRINNGKTKGWREVYFLTNDSITSGSYIWFGLFSEYMWYPRFDYGSKCYYQEWEDEVIPNSYPLNSDYHENYKLSMFFFYTESQTHLRTLIQGITLNDSQKLVGGYKRQLLQNAGVHSIFDRITAFYRGILDNLRCNASGKISIDFIRLLSERMGLNDIKKHIGFYCRELPDGTEADGKVQTGRVFFTPIVDTVQAAGAVLRGMCRFVHIVTHVFVRDYVLPRFLFAREELVLKSAICREFILDSKIN